MMRCLLLLTATISNVLRQDEQLSFYLLVDLSCYTMWLYYVDSQQDTRTLIRSYDVGLGRSDPTASSHSLTPLGKYQLGQRTQSLHQACRAPIAVSRLR